MADGNRQHGHTWCESCGSCHDHERCPLCGVGHPRKWECPPEHGTEQRGALPLDEALEEMQRSVEHARRLYFESRDENERLVAELTRLRERIRRGYRDARGCRTSYVSALTRLYRLVEIPDG